jgi:type IV pilus assembly protein PilC
MPIYAYKARDAAGKAVKGSMEALSKAALIDKLHGMGYMVTAVSEARPELEIGSYFEKLKRISSDELLMFYVQLANMLGAGINILTALGVLSKQVENKKLKEAVGDISRQVEAGNKLSAAFALHPQIFSRLFVSMIKTGEETGKLDSVLLRYATFFEEQEELKRKIKGALFYPVILLCFGIAVTLFLVTFIIPQFAQIYLKAGIRLPLATLVVYKIGLAIKYYWYLFAALAAVVIFLLTRYFNTDSGSFFLDRLKLRLYIIGPLYRKVCISRFTRTLATLLGSGVPILGALDITKEVVYNKVLTNVIDNVRRSVEKGERIAEPLKVSEEFPPDVVQMVSVGEEAGKLVEMLNKAANFYDLGVNYAVKKLTTIIEPLFLVIMGIMVGVIMASMLMPIFDMIKTLHR